MTRRTPADRIAHVEARRPKPPRVVILPGPAPMTAALAEIIRVAGAPRAFGRVAFGTGGHLMLTGRCRACLDLTHGQTCHCENDE